MPITKTGEQITWKEFMERWKTGIQQVTPLQTTVINLYSQILVLIGVIIGLYFTWKTKWLFIILIGSFGLAVVSLIGTIQKYLLFKDIQNKLKEVSNEQESPV